MKPHWVLLALTGVLVIGCGGESVSKTSSILGTVLDIDNNPVRDALVTTRFGSTRTSPTGAYTLPAQGNGAVEVTASLSRNGVQYRGRATAFDYVNERTQSVNIIVGPVNELGSISGNVQDRFGNALQDASVFAYNGAGSSVRVFSDENGDYQFRDLVGGVTYTVLAGGQGFRSDSTQIILGTSDSRTANFVLDDPGLPNLQPPQNVFATSWVSPSDATRLPKGSPYDAIKKLIDPKYKGHKQGKASRAPSGMQVEVDLEWDEQRFPDLLGYGIYRAASSNGALTGVDFLPEPLAAFYVDMDVQPNTTYSHCLTTISAAFPDFPDQTESDLSTRVVSQTLDKLNLSNPTLNPLTFRWQSGSGADSFVVFVFDEFPGIGVDSIWNNSGNRATGTSATYTGPPLTAGQTYYYVVVGLANNDDSRTISQIASFKL
ncbi:MAG: carboxypeptidase regulatory-like domain-containing protein [Armatimonadetes bacterium]|nr:carboxypeptidase regulatory-like domain-containing protein [Armatimonadota bacterium]